MARKLTALLLLVTPHECDAACACKATPANPQQTAAATAPAFVGEVAAYGWGCAAHDAWKGTCDGASELGDGEANDWCLDKWCIVDETTCDMRSLELSYTADTTDYFSYEACDANFAGNSFAGYCKNCPGKPDSFCQCGGIDGCQCKAAATKQHAAQDKPAYVDNLPAYGSGCKAHDEGQDVCSGATDTADGQAHDWCLDQWCIVDATTCNRRLITLSYTADSNDYFSYEACDASFNGNAFSGYCKNCQDKPDSFCACGGIAGCKCKAAATKQSSAVGKPAFVGQVPAYGSGCKAHDLGQGSCNGATDTADGKPNDWCLDEWCIVDESSCDVRTIALTYTANTNDYFSYEACDVNFAGNSFAGYCKNCADKPDSFCQCGGIDGCQCKGAATKQTPAIGKPAYVGQAPAYGSGCKAHDEGQDSCSGATNTAYGEASDWCLDQWCIVDATTCNRRLITLSYTADSNDYFSYEACDINFAGNAFSGYCKNCQDKPDSFCACGGIDGCKCKAAATQQSSAVGKPAFVGQVPAYGSGCKAHDLGQGSCNGATDTADGKPNDWCLDEWCIVDESSCDVRTIALSYTANTNDYFSYEACDASFAGNSFAGYCRNCEGKPNSYCMCEGIAGCRCKGGATKQTPAADAPAYVGEADAYGFGCKAHDQGQGSCNGATDTSDGQPNDWCLDQWCIVDQTTCDRRSIALSFTANTNDYFSYEACDSNFAGNSWAGYCKNCDGKPDSFCQCGGTDGCKCKAAATKQTSAANKPAYVGQVPAYGSGCKAHDQGKDSCYGATNTAAGEPNDWCLDQWCIVDETTCDKRSIALSYTANTNDYFSYEACNSDFNGNSYAGYCKNCPDKPDSFCACGGLDGCKCKPAATKKVSAQGKPAFVGQVPAYGSGCKAHDQGQGTCKNANNTADGEANDWCLDAYCIVDKNNCNLKATALSYTASTNDYFSYETCNANFAGNGFVGRCKCTDNAGSYCTCSGDNDGTDTDVEGNVDSARKSNVAALTAAMMLAAFFF